MIYINEVEVADILATNATIDELVTGEIDSPYGSNEDLYEHDEENDIDTFKDEVQDVFNRWYDYYWNILFDNKIGKEE